MNMKGIAKPIALRICYQLQPCEITEEIVEPSIQDSNRKTGCRVYRSCASIRMYRRNWRDGSCHPGQYGQP
jgi:hypothetical protein